MTQHNAVFSNTGLIIRSENEFVKKLFKMGINPLNECYNKVCRRRERGKKLSTKTAAVQNIQHRICIAAAENPALASGRHNR